jgi:LysM repeat protein
VIDIHPELRKMKKSSGIVSFVLLCILHMLLGTTSMAQAAVKISAQIETFGQKSYYMHTVEPRQTLFGIAQAYKVTVENLLMANPDARRGLRVNQVLRVPISDQTPAPEAQQAPTQETPPAIADRYEYIYHVSGKRETFSYIANIYMVPVNQIRSANPTLREPIPEGEYVVVPIAPKEPQTEANIREQRSSFDPFSSPPVKTPSSQGQTTQRGQAAQQQPIQPPQQQAQTQPAIGITEVTTPAQAVSEDSGVEIISHFSMADAEQQVTSLPVSSAGEGYGQHAVKPKETLFSIARQYELTVDQLMALNPGISKMLSVGQVLRVPQKDNSPQSAQPKQADDMITHTVSKGETLYRISRDYAVSISELQQINPGLTERLTVGQKIMVPKKKITSPYFEHEIDSRTSVRRLSRNFEISRDRFYYFNPAVGRRVYPGQKVRIPIADHLTLSTPMPVQVDTVLIEQPQFTEQMPEKIISCPDYPAQAHRMFRVALMVPFFLDDAEKLYSEDLSEADQLLSERPFSFLQFYEGFLMAVDSLVAYEGLKLDLYVYDVGQSMDEVAAAIGDPKLRSTDLIIGPFFNQGFELVSSFAREHNIPIVNPMAQRSEIIDGFPNVIKVKPTTDSQYDQVALLISEQYPDAKVFIYRAHSWAYSEQSQLMRKAIEQYLKPAVAITNQKIYSLANERSKMIEEFEGIIPVIPVEGVEFSTAQLEEKLYEATIFENPVIEFVYANDSVREFRKQASALRENVVIAISDDNVFAMELVNKMSQVSDTFSIKMIGLPNWKNFDNLFTESLLKMQMHHLVPGHIDYNTLQTEQFIYKYRMRYSAEPGAYAFEGFDIGWYFLQALMRYGNNMLDCLPNYFPPLSQTRFHFQQKDEASGIENEFWNIYRYQNHQLVPLNNTYFDQINPARQTNIW